MEFVDDGHLPGGAVGPSQKHLPSAYVTDNVVKIATAYKTRLESENSDKFTESGVRIITMDFDSEDSLIDSFIPADSFRIEHRDRRMSKIRELLGYVKCVGRFENDDHFHIFVPKLETTTAWAATTAYSVRDVVIPTTANEVVYVCSVAGTSAGSKCRSSIRAR